MSLPTRSSISPAKRPRDYQMSAEATVPRSLKNRRSDSETLPTWPVSGVSKSPASGKTKVTNVEKNIARNERFYRPQVDPHRKRGNRNPNMDRQRAGHLPSAVNPPSHHEPSNNEDIEMLGWRPSAFRRPLPSKRSKPNVDDVIVISSDEELDGMLRPSFAVLFNCHTCLQGPSSQKPVTQAPQPSQKPQLVQRPSLPRKPPPPNDRFHGSKRKRFDPSENVIDLTKEDEPSLQPPPPKRVSNYL
ncbi:hypothetical protein K439DRAFT_842532 [Ramaria rubella]|nr:hypothetical protein K439DRAFT_842532 [Ramaria rubella]